MNDDIEQINVSIESQDKKYAIDIIRKFGKFKDTKKIEEYVEFIYALCIYTKAIERADIFTLAAVSATISIICNSEDGAV